MKKNYLSRLFLLITFAFSATGLLAQVVYVKQDATGSNDGSSWQNAYTKLETALANTTSGEIWVAAGTYKPEGGTATDSTSALAVHSSFSLYGGFAGTESSLDQRNPVVNVTILSGDINGDDVSENFTANKSDNTRHVVYVDSLLSDPVTIDGFSIIGGHTGNFESTPAYFRSGGGIYALSPVAVANCNFYNNFGRSGACIAIAGGGSGSEISDCVFTKNYTTAQAAAIFLNGLSDISVVNSSFTANKTNRGAMYPLNCTGVSIDNCNFEANINDQGAGGALFIFGSTGITLTNSFFTNNKAVNSGAVYYDGDQVVSTNADNFVIQNCSFTGNSTTGGVGGAMRSLRGSYTMENCIFENSNSTGSGGHIRNDVVGDNVIYRNCTFRNATSGGWGGAHTCYGEGVFVIENCTYEGNTTTNLGGAVNCGFRAMVSIDGCTFNSNISNTSAGGALAMQNDSTALVVTNSTFTGNKSSAGGGAIHGGSGSSYVTIDKCEFSANEITGTTGVGGAINASEGGDDDIGFLNLSNSIFLYNIAPVQAGALNLSNVDATIYNCLFSNNVANDLGTGGAISNNCSDSNHVEVLILNTTIADNAGALAGGIANWTGTLEVSSNLTLQNCILRQDGLKNYAIEDGTPEVVSNGGNMSDDLTLEDYLMHVKDINEVDPDFVDPDDFNYRLADDSPGIDAGVADGAPEFDLDGNPRINEVDMGAYENQTTVKTKELLVENSGMLGLSPNPATTRSVKVTLENNWSGNLQVRLFNVMGQTVRMMEIEKNSDVLQFEFPLDEVKTGVYDLLISNGSQAVTERLVNFKN